MKLLLEKAESDTIKEEPSKKQQNMATHIKPEHAQRLI